MKRPLHPRQVRAARALLAMSQEELAGEANIGLATVKRFESGRGTRGTIERSLRTALEKRGVIFIEAATSIGGVMIGAGVAVRSDAFDDSTDRETAKSSMEGPRRTRSV